MNIALLLQMAADTCPDRQAITFEGRHYTYQDLYQAARRAAHLFAASGCNYVSLLDVSSPAVPVALFGAAMAGLPYVPLNYRLSREQLSPLLTRIDPAWLIVGDEVLGEGGGEGAGRDGSEDGVASPHGTLRTRSTFMAEVFADGDCTDAWHEDPAAVAVQLFTSGTTGTPKAALLRNEHLVSYILGSVEFMGADESEATLVSVPPYHIAGISAIMSSIYACRRIVQLPNFSADEWVSLCINEKVTNAFVVPTMLSRIVDEIESVGPASSGVSSGASSSVSSSFESLNAIAYGGGKMPLPVIERALNLLPHINFTNAYGLTETSSTITLLDPDDHRAVKDGNADRARLGSVGKPLPTVELEIRDESGKALPPGEPGEIYVRGPQVSGEYEGRSVLDNDGWFPTRDAGYLDEDGYLYLSGRADDVIVRGGENISPGEIEDLLHEHDAVLDAAAVGVPSEEWGEAVALAIVCKQDFSEDEIRDYIKAHLRSSRVPEKIHYAEELPYNETGKLLRRVVREWLNQRG